MEENSKASNFLLASKRSLTMSTMSRSRPFTNRSYKAPFIKSKKVMAVILMAGLVEYIQFLSFITLQAQQNSSPYVIGLLVSFYLLYPVLGYIGEKFTRYKVLLTGITIVNLSLWIVIILFVIDFNTHSSRSIDTFLAVLKIAFIALGVIGAGLFNANIIQFGTDQIQFASSTEMATFSRWFMLFYSLAVLLAGILRPIAKNTSKLNLNTSIIFYATGGVISLSALISLLLTIVLRKSFEIDEPTFLDPVKQIFGVMRFAWKHKEPLN